jgi:hypothetical protein
LIQHVGVGVTQSLDAGITIIGVEMVVMPNMDFLRRGVLFESVVKLGNGSNGVLVRRNLSQSSALLVLTNGVVGTHLDICSWHSLHNYVYFISK